MAPVAYEVDFGMTMSAVPHGSIEHKTNSGTVRTYKVQKFKKVIF